MEPLATVIPKKVARSDTTNFELCLICQVEGGDLVRSPAYASYEKVLEYINLRSEYKDCPYPSISEHLHSVSASTLQECNARWHRDCYSTTCHKKMLEAAKKRYNKSIQAGKNPILSQLPSRPASVPKAVTSDSISHPFTRSSSTPFSTSLCFFCQQDGASLGKLHEVTTFNADEKLKSAVDASGSDTLKVKLSTAIDPKDARAIDVKYHLKCWVTNVDRVLSKGQKASTSCTTTQTEASTEEKQKLALAEIEFFSMLHSLLADGSVLGMSTLQETYINIRKKNGVDNPEISRPTLKQRIKEHFGDVQFGKPLNRTESERVYLKTVGDVAMQQVIDAAEYQKDNTEIIFKCAKLLRKSIATMPLDGWTFQGSLLNSDEHIPPQPFSFLRWLVIGPTPNIENRGRDEKVHREIKTIADVIL